MELENCRLVCRNYHRQQSSMVTKINGQKYDEKEYYIVPP